MTTQDAYLPLLVLRPKLNLTFPYDNGTTGYMSDKRDEFQVMSPSNETDQPSDTPTERVSYRGAMAQLKIEALTLAYLLFPQLSILLSLCLRPDQGS